MLECTYDIRSPLAMSVAVESLMWVGEGHNREVQSFTTQELCWWRKVKTTAELQLEEE